MIVIGQVSGHMLGHVASEGVGSHIRFSQDHVVVEAPLALDYRWALGLDFGFGQSRASLVTIYVFETTVVVLSQHHFSASTSSTCRRCVVTLPTGFYQPAHFTADNIHGVGKALLNNHLERLLMCY